MSKFFWASVTQVSPLRIKIDGDSSALLITPDSLVDPLSLVVGSRVRCELSDSKITVLGQSGGTPYIPRTNFTPTFTNFTLGNGTINAAWYAMSNGLVTTQGRVTLGSTSVVSGDISLLTPIVPVNGEAQFGGRGRVQDASAGEQADLFVIVDFPGKIVLRGLNANATPLKVQPQSSTFPIPFTVSDVLQWTAIYYAL